MEKLKDKFKVLGVDPEAPFDEIEAAYRKKLALWQANLEKDAGKPHLLRKNEEQIQEVTEAFHSICNHFRDYGRPDFAAPDPGEVREEPETTPAATEEEAPVEGISERLPEDEEKRVLLVKAIFFGSLFLIVLFAGVIFAVIMVRLTGSRGKSPQLQSGITYQRYSSVAAVAPVQRRISARPKIESTTRARAAHAVRKKHTAVPQRKEGAPVAHYAHWGSVLSARSAGEFTYVEVSEQGRSVWVALPRTDRVTAGDRLEFPGTPSLLNYYCPALSRSVDKMVFPGAYVVNGRKFVVQ